jgi:hypothetical protein
MNNELGRSVLATDHLYAARNKEDFSGTVTGLKWNNRRHGFEIVPQPGSTAAMKGHYDSEIIECDFPAKEFLPAWNMDIDESQQGYRIFLRVRGETGGWSPWFYLGSGGTLVPKRGSSSRVLTHPAWGKVKIDYLTLLKPAITFQYRVVLSANHGNTKKSPSLKRFFVSYSGEGSEPQSVKAGVASRRKSISIPVPYRSQKAVDEEHLRGHICCPTCVSMVLEYNDIDLPTMTVCRQAYDPETDIYGVWPRATHTAALHGLEAWIQRFRNHDQVRAMLLGGQPIMASIRVDNGELHGAEYQKSNGHLILLVGFRSNGDYIVNDPYTLGPRGGAIDYSQGDIEKVWLDKGGVGLIIKKPEST